MQDLHREGLIKAIGVSNFYPDRLVDLADHNDVTPALSQTLAASGKSGSMPVRAGV